MQTYEEKSKEARNYRLQSTVFIGIDVHLKQWNVCIIYDGRTYKPFQQPPTAAALSTYLKRNFPNMTYLSAYESGFCGFGPHFDLLSEGINNIVFNAADIASKGKELRRKSDSVDAKKIARELAKGELQPVYTPSWEKICTRSLSRLRSLTVNSIARLKIQIRHFLHYYHIEIPECFQSKHWTRAFIAWIREVCTYERIGEAAFEAKILLGRLCQQMEELKSINRKIIEVMHTPEYEESYNLLLSVPGSGACTASLVLLEVGDLSEFSSIEKFCSYIGLVPDYKRSDDDEYGTCITHRKHSELRKKFIECAWRAVAVDETMQRCFAKWRRKMPHNKAIIRVACKLAKCVKSILKNRKKYEARHLE